MKPAVYTYYTYFLIFSVFEASSVLSKSELDPFLYIWYHTVRTRNGLRFLWSQPGEPKLHANYGHVDLEKVLKRHQITGILTILWSHSIWFVMDKIPVCTITKAPSRLQRYWKLHRFFFRLDDLSIPRSLTFFLNHSDVCCKLHYQSSVKIASIYNRTQHENVHVPKTMPATKWH